MNPFTARCGGRRPVLLAALGLLLLWHSAAADEPAAVPQSAVRRLENRPKVPGTLELAARSRRESPPGSGRWEPVEEVLRWQAAETAIIICDMWDDHWCRSAAARVDVLAPRMNQVVSAARDLGVQIIHAPSDTMNYYKDTPYRRRMQAAAAAEPPVPIKPWCGWDASREGPLPIDDSGGGCDDPRPSKGHQAWTRQHQALTIVGFDGISDDGAEIYNFCRQEGIKNLVLMGVHTNMCVLGRSFGIRQMTAAGFNVVLARDLTDALYDPRQAPYVSHARGTELVVEHIERYWCPSIASDGLCRVASGTSGPQAP